MTMDEFGKVCFKEKLEEEGLLETKFGKGSSRIQVLTQGAKKGQVKMGGYRETIRWDIAT